ncbi:uncharacterized protein LOC111122602 isoform X2 [Crassostrea virginica]
MGHLSHSDDLHVSQWPCIRCRVSSNRNYWTSLYQIWRLLNIIFRIARLQGGKNSEI